MNKKLMTVLGATLVPGTALAVTLVALTAAGHDSGRRATIKSTSLSDGTTVVDSSVGETFTAVTTPSSKVSARLISPDRAFHKADGPAQELPAGTSVQLGRLTLPVGAGAPGQYNAKDQLVYAFTWRQCAPNIGPFDPTSPSASPSDSTYCTAWLFVDAETGKMVDQTWTQ